MNPRASPNTSPRKQLASPQMIEADVEDFSCRLNISGTKRPAHTSPRPAHSSVKHKLFNPQTDPIPMRHTAEPESISDATSSSYAPRGLSANPPGLVREPSAHQRQLFDHRKDDPVRFSVLARPSSTNGNRPTPTSKSSADYVSASSTSSYAHSQVSSTFTLSSNTMGGSSASSAVFDRPTEEPGNNAFAVQLKRLYRGILALEGKILKEEADDNNGLDDGRVVVQGRGKEMTDEDAEVQKWNKMIGDHKQ